ncbi:multicopper oxidase family protein [Candidatus Kaiserbacteria bacterium]|nr:multicopper oxidase family protein [Candidatus Kaiserbacteria bacterium]
MKRYLVIAAIAAAVILGVVFAGWQRAPQARASEVVMLADGDAYTLTTSYVTKEIGGREQRMMAYNGSIPGPTIRVKQGSTITITLKNDTDRPAALHSHGLRLDNRFDGAPPLTQQEIPPGGSFEYTLTFPDAGIYWYHPHAEEVVQQLLGQYGAFVVEPSDAAYFPSVDREEVLFLSDLPVENGKIAIEADGKGRALMGHYGNTMLVNGSDDFTLEAKKGEVMRLYVVNASNARPYRVAIPDARMKLVGGDSGAYERATFVGSIVLGPSERAIMDVLFSTSTEILNETPAGTAVLGKISVDESEVASAREVAFDASWANAATSEGIAPFRAYFGKSPDKTISLGVEMAMGGMGSMGGSMDGHGMHMMPDGTMMDGSGATMNMQQSPDGIEWEDTGGMMSTLTSDAVQWHITDTATGKKDMDIDWTFAKDTPVKIRIVNSAQGMHPMQHPIHFHGQRFLVVARDGVPQSNLAWKDTALVKAGETVDIILDPSNPGEWMAHCHIAEHLAAGMMFHFRVE